MYGSQDTHPIPAPPFPSSPPPHTPPPPPQAAARPLGTSAIAAAAAAHSDGRLGNHKLLKTAQIFVTRFSRHTAWARTACMRRAPLPLISSYTFPPTDGRTLQLSVFLATQVLAVIQCWPSLERKARDGSSFDGAGGPTDCRCKRADTASGRRQGNANAWPSKRYTFISSDFL